MPQVDLETLVSACAGGSCDRKIACETLAVTTNTNDNHSQPPPQPDSPDLAEVPPDFPPESFWLSKDAELDWFSTNAYYERKDSTKGNSNSTNLNPNIIPNPNSNPSNSQRFSSFHTKAAIIGLPKPHKSTFDAKNRRNCKHGNTRLFPKRSGSTGKSDSTAMVEPSSPKVSCMGRVRSKKERNRRLRKQKQQQQQQQEQRSFRSMGKKESTKKDKKQKTGFFASFKAIFRSKSNSKDKSLKSGNDTSFGGSVSESYAFKKSSDIRDRLPASDGDAPPRRSCGMEPVAGLGGMTRFTSGRRSESWSAEIDVA